MAPSAKSRRTRHAAGITLGRAAAAKIQAVEGIALSAEAQAMFRAFDAQGLSPAERRRRILERHAKRAR